MGKRISSEERLNLYYASFGEKVIKAFKAFPKKNALIQEIFNALRSDRCQGITVSYSFEYTKNIELYVDGVGGVRKEYTQDPYGYQLCFFEGDNYTNNHRTEILTEEEADAIGHIILSFLLSRGKNIEKVPLLMHDFPEFTKYALRYKNET